MGAIADAENAVSLGSVLGILLLLIYFGNKFFSTDQGKGTAQGFWDAFTFNNPQDPKAVGTSAANTAAATTSTGSAGANAAANVEPAAIAVDDSSDTSEIAGFTA